MAQQYEEYTEAAHHVFVNNVFGAFFRGVADFFGNTLFDRSKEIIVGTYEKAVQYYNQLRTEAGEKHAPGIPFITLNPSLDFEPEEVSSKFFYQYPNFQKKFAGRQFNPLIYKDDNIEIAPVLNRYRGSFELIIWCSSVYELMDYRVLTYQFFGGVGRVIYPKNISGYIVLPDEVVYYTYDNPYTGQSYQIDWSANQAVGTLLIKNINKDKLVFPFEFTPWLRLNGVSDASERYGADELSEYKLSLDIEWECSIPTHLIIHSQALPPICNLTFELDVGSQYMIADDLDVSTDKLILKCCDENSKKRFDEYTLLDVYNYQLTVDDENALQNDQNVLIALPNTIDVDTQSLTVYGKYGVMREGYHWRFEPPNQVELLGFAIENLKAGDMIYIIRYQKN